MSNLLAVFLAAVVFFVGVGGFELALELFDPDRNSAPREGSRDVLPISRTTLTVAILGKFPTTSPPLLDDTVIGEIVVSFSEDITWI